MTGAIEGRNPEVTEVGRPLNIRCVWAGLRLTMKSYRAEYCSDGTADPNYVGACRAKILSRKYVEIHDAARIRNTMFFAALSRAKHNIAQRQRRKNQDGDQHGFSQVWQHAMLLKSRQFLKARGV